VATGEFKVDEVGTNIVTNLEMRCIINEADPSGVVNCGPRTSITIRGYWAS